MAVTFGGQQTSTLLADHPSREKLGALCIPVHDPYGDNWLISFGFSRFRDVERRATVRVLRRQAATTDRPRAHDPTS